jgi:hypothetical protein
MMPPSREEEKKDRSRFMLAGEIEKKAPLGKQDILK